MLPTLTIPSVAPPPPRGSEPTNSPTAEGEGGDAFADALQRAQGGPKLAQGKEPSAQTAKSTDPHARSPHHAQAKSVSREDAQQPDSEPACSDMPASTPGNEWIAGDAAAHPAAAADEATTQPTSPVIGIDPLTAPPAAAETSRSEQPCAIDTDTEEPALAIDKLAAPARPNPRVGGAQDQRAGPSIPGHGTLPNEPASGRDAAVALPLHAAVERTSGETTAAPTGPLRAPSFERLAIESAAPPVATASFTRELGAAAAANVESRLPQATLHTAVDEPTFGTALGTQVAVWVRDGVQEARLQLHPAELGPVIVQIALEGQAAHVDFTAAVAATRDSIEQSLPALAAALREAGFTLTGGGVSSQGGSERHGQRAGVGQGNRSRSDASLDAGHAVTAPRRWTRSLLDVYA